MLPAFNVTTFMPLARMSVHPCLYLLVALTASGVLILCSHQDFSLGVTVGARLCQFMALVFLLAFIVNALRVGWWAESAVCAVALALEVRLFKRWQRKSSQAR